MEAPGGRHEDTADTALRRPQGAAPATPAAAPAPRGRGGLRTLDARAGGPAECAAYRAYDAKDGGYGALALAEEETAAQILLRGLIDDAGLCPPATRHYPQPGRSAPPDAAEADSGNTFEGTRAESGRFAPTASATARHGARSGRYPPDSPPLPLVQAVERHRSDRIVGHPMLSHRLLCPASRWGDLVKRLDGSGPVDVSLILDTAAGRAGELPERDPRAHIAHYETRAHPDDLRLVAELFRSGDIGAAGRIVYFEPAREAGWLDAVDILSGARPLGAKLRCGGRRFEQVPGVGEIGAFITACAERDVPFVVTAGLHQAAGRIDPETGTPQYGYLNLLLATAAAAEGDYDALTDLLTSTDTEQLARLAVALHPATALRTRELLVGYASRSTGDPVREAAALGLLGTWVV